MRHVKNAFLLEGENNSKIAFLEGAIENTGLSTESPDTFKVPSGTQMHLSPYFQQLYVTVADESIKDQNWYIWRDNQSVCQADGDLEILNRHLKSGDIAKIVGTTHTTLIKTGVQELDDVFLMDYIKDCPETVYVNSKVQGQYEFGVLQWNWGSDHPSVQAERTYTESEMILFAGYCQGKQSMGYGDVGEIVKMFNEEFKKS